MKKDKFALLALVVCTFLFLIAGCGKKGIEKVNIPELGFSMNLPEGWKVDTKDPYFFYAREDQYNNFGDVVTMPSEGLPLEKFVEKQLESEMKMEQLGEKLLSKVTGITGIPGTEIVSKTTRDINGKNAVELVIHREGYHIFSVWMQKGQDIIRVSFQVSDDRYPVDKNSLVTATNSIKIN